MTSTSPTRASRSAAIDVVADVSLDSMSDDEFFASSTVSETTVRAADHVGHLYGLDSRQLEALHVPRHRFVPRKLWISVPRSPARTITMRADRMGWIAALHHSDTHIIVDVDGRPVAQSTWRQLQATVTASVPSWQDAAAILAAARLVCGIDVLHIAGGSGWFTEVIAEFEPASVVCLQPSERHAKAAGRARRKYQRDNSDDNPWSLSGPPETEVVIAVGDAAAGVRARAPYDRIVSELAVTAVPPAWLAQARPGCAIVAPWRAPDGACLLMQLHVNRERVATGSFTAPVTGLPHTTGRLRLPNPPAHLPMSRTRLDAAAMAEDPDTRLGVALRTPDCRMWRDRDRIAITHPPSRSYAVLTAAGTRQYEIRQSGPRRLWDDTVRAWQAWRQSGSPGIGDYRITATSTHTTVWHRDRDNILWTTPHAATPAPAAAAALAPTNTGI